MIRAVMYVPTELDAYRPRGLLREALDFADRTGLTVVSSTGDELAAFTLIGAGLADVVLVSDPAVLRRVAVVGWPLPVLSRPSPLTRRPRPVG